jgi:ferredoxin
MVFYFTGTGNSKYIAQRIAESEHDRLCSIAQAVRDGNFTYQLKENEAVGFVLPVYFGGLPSVIREFIDKVQLSGAEGKYIYLVLTCGGFTCNAGGMFVKRMAKRGYEVSAQYAVLMPDNYVLLYNMKSDEEVKTTLAKADRELAIITREIQSRKTGDSNNIKGFFPKAATALMYPFYDRARKTKKFYATDACTGCGHCAKICPCNAIELKSKSPVWIKEKCTQCLACLHRCPTRAIQFGKSTQKRGRYVNPAVEM